MHSAGPGATGQRPTGALAEPQRAAPCAGRASSCTPPRCTHVAELVRRSSPWTVPAGAAASWREWAEQASATGSEVR
ncbi:MAG: hypothetical protein ACRDQ5_00770 [Sciscionella sp.]